QFWATVGRRPSPACPAKSRYRRAPGTTTPANTSTTSPPIISPPRCPQRPSNDCRSSPCSHFGPPDARASLAWIFWSTAARRSPISTSSTRCRDSPRSACIPSLSSTRTSDSRSSSPACASLRRPGMSPPNGGPRHHSAFPSPRPRGMVRAMFELPPRVLSGVQPSGELHLGNYFGAIRQHIALQDELPGECYFFIADYHALTT